MSQDGKDIGKLLKNIQEGLQRFSVQELNKAITSYIKKRSIADMGNIIEYALKLVCDEYDISRRSLMSNNKKRATQDAKRIAYTLLHDELGLTIRYIASNVFSCYPNTVVSGISKLKSADANIKHEKVWLDKYFKLRKKMTDKIAEQKQIQHIEHENIS